MAVRKSTENGNVSSPAQGLKGGRAERAIHTQSAEGQCRKNGRRGLTDQVFTRRKKGIGLGPLHAEEQD